MRIGLLLVCLAAAGCTQQDTARQPVPEAYDYHAVPHVIFYDDGEPLALERGIFFSPLDHETPDGALLELPFYRIPSSGETSAPPLFLLAGGPGNSYLDDFQRSDFLRWIEFYREIGDIVILEQRGASEAHPKPACDYPVDLDPDEPATIEVLSSLLRDRALRCASTWREAGLDLSFFTIEQMARDFDGLRAALGYEQFNLKGGSFGSQLGLTILRNHEESVHRAILYGVEGLDHTYDLPALANRQLDKVTVEVGADPALGRLVPDFRQLTRQVLDRLAAEPARVTLPDPESGDPVKVAVGAIDAQLILWSQPLLQGYREGIAKAPALLLAAAQGEFAPFAKAKLEWLQHSGEVNVMTYLVDCSSGLTGERQALLDETDPDWVLHPSIIDYHLHAVCPALDVPDVGNEFRRGKTIETPVLLISGSLDAFTPPEYAERTIDDFPAGHWLLADRGDHSGWRVLEEFPALKQAARDFLTGEPLPEDFPSRVEMPSIDFLLPEMPAGEDPVT